MNDSLMQRKVNLNPTETILKMRRILDLSKIVGLQQIWIRIRTRHVEYPPMLITMANIKGDVLPSLITGTVGPALSQFAVDTAHFLSLLY